MRPSPFLTLAIGIGTNTTIFVIVDELVFKAVRGVGYENVYQVGSIQIPDYDTLSPISRRASPRWRRPITAVVCCRSRAARRA